MLHSGIDLHKRDLVIATVAEDGKLLAQQRLPASRELVRRYFAGFEGPHQAVVESTATWYWLADLLAEIDVPLKLAHAKHLKAISYAKVKTDSVDSHTIGQLDRADLIPEAHMISAELRGQRDLMRARLVIVQKRTSCLNSIEAILAKYNEPSMEALPELPRMQAKLAEQQAMLLETQIKKIEKALHPLLLPNDDVQNMLWIPGFGMINAFTVYLEIDDIVRFKDVRNFLSYARLVPGADNSGGKTKHRRSKDGNRYLKLAFAHAAVRAIQYYPEIKAFYRKWARKKPKAVARAIVAKELGKTVYYVLKKKEPYDNTFKGKLLSTTKQPEWPRRRSPDA
jgi:transposase